MGKSARKQVWDAVFFKIDEHLHKHIRGAVKGRVGFNIFRPIDRTTKQHINRVLKGKK